jgi:hypothetical protein
MSETAKFRRIDESKSRRKKSYRQDKEKREAHLKDSGIEHHEVTEKRKCVRCGRILPLNSTARACLYCGGTLVSIFGWYLNTRCQH